jgi:glutathione S-transferase
MGQAGYAKRQSDDSFERFNKESHRLVSVMEGALSDKDYLAGDYSIADIMNFGWLDRAPDYFGFDLSLYPNVTGWLARINNRPAVKVGLAAFD